MTWRPPNKNEEDALVPPPPESDEPVAWHERLLRRWLGPSGRCPPCGRPGVPEPSENGKNKPS